MSTDLRKHAAFIAELFCAT